MRQIFAFSSLAGAVTGQSAGRVAKAAAVLLTGFTASLVAGHAFAQDIGRVLSSTAIITQTQVPRQTCTTETVVQTGAVVTKSGAGAVMGGVAGGAIGNAMGNGTGRAAATMLGILGGAILGNKVEGDNVQTANTPQTVQRCTTQTFLENRTTGYNVVYEYAGKQYSVVMPNDPGTSIQLQIAPVGTLQPAPTAAVPAPVQAPVPTPAVTTVIPAPVVYAPAPAQVIVLQQPVVVDAPVVTYTYPAVQRGAVVISSGYHGHGHAHYRGYGYGHGSSIVWSTHQRAPHWR